MVSHQKKNKAKKHCDSTRANLDNLGKGAKKTKNISEFSAISFESTERHRIVYLRPSGFSSVTSGRGRIPFSTSIDFFKILSIRSRSASVNL